MSGFRIYIMNPTEINILLRYQGEINGPIITELLDDLDYKCINLDVPDLKRKKLFNIAVEMFQNLYHYTRDLCIEGYEDGELRSIYLVFQVDDEFYYLITQNYMKASDEAKLRSKIDKVNDMNGPELKSYYKQVLNNTQFSQKGGAGLGFIDMKKRSGWPLEYEIIDADHELKKYTLTVKVKK